MVRVVRCFGGLPIVAGLCLGGCGAPDLTYRDESSSSDGGPEAAMDGGSDVSPDTSADAPRDVGDSDAGSDVQPDVSEAGPDAPADSPADGPGDDVDSSSPCPWEMTPVARGDGTDFCIDSHEVSQQAYSAWLSSSPDPSSQTGTCDSNDSYDPDLVACSGGSYTPAVTPELPVTCVDWCDAKAYCLAMDKRLCGALAGGSASFQQHADPGESQWMRACSAAGSRVYPYGDVYEQDRCNGSDYGAGAPVEGAFLECVGGVTGLYDMSGNVGEWEDSCNGPAPVFPCRVRGGSYLEGAEDLRCDTAREAKRRDVMADVGFRCCTN